MRLYFAVLILMLGACATPKSKISEKIGCPAEETRVIDIDPGFGVDNTAWRASCGEKQYSCKTGAYMGKFFWLDDMKCQDTPKGTSGYLSKEELQIERKSQFDSFLEGLVPPETSKQ